MKRGEETIKQEQKPIPISIQSKHVLSLPCHCILQKNGAKMMTQMEKKDDKYRNFIIIKRKINDQDEFLLFRITISKTNEPIFQFEFKDITEFYSKFTGEGKLTISVASKEHLDILGKPSIINILLSNATPELLKMVLSIISDELKRLKTVREGKSTVTPIDRSSIKVQNISGGSRIVNPKKNKFLREGNSRIQLAQNMADKQARLKRKFTQMNAQNPIKTVQTNEAKRMKMMDMGGLRDLRTQQDLENEDILEELLSENEPISNSKPKDLLSLLPQHLFQIILEFLGKESFSLFLNKNLIETVDQMRGKLIFNKKEIPPHNFTRLLGRSPRLKELYLERLDKIKNKEMIYFPVTLYQLQILDISRVRNLNDQSIIKILSKTRVLEKLLLPITGAITDITLNYCAQLKQLVSIGLIPHTLYGEYLVRVTERGICNFLREAQKLETLDLFFISKSIVNTLIEHQAQITNLNFEQILTNEKPPARVGFELFFGIKIMEIIGDLGCLQSLSALSICPNIREIPKIESNSPFFMDLKRVVIGCKKLREFKIGGLLNADLLGLLIINSGGSLERLEIHSPYLTDMDIEFIGNKCTNLRVLDVSQSLCVSEFAFTNQYHWPYLRTLLTSIEQYYSSNRYKEMIASYYPRLALLYEQPILLPK